MAAMQLNGFLTNVYQHIVLPRQVPEAENGDLEHIETVLWDRMVDAVKAITPFAPIADQGHLDSLRLSLSASKAVHIQGRIDQKFLTRNLESLERGHSLLLYLAQQNAAILIYLHAR